jgi:hypothetical protein
VAPPYSERILDYSECNLLSGRAAKSRFEKPEKVVLHIDENGVYRALDLLSHPSCCISKLRSSNHKVAYRQRRKRPGM